MCICDFRTLFALSECTKDPEYPLAETLDVLERMIERLASLVDVGGLFD